MLAAKSKLNTFMFLFFITFSFLFNARAFCTNIFLNYTIHWHILQLFPPIFHLMCTFFKQSDKSLIMFIQSNEKTPCKGYTRTFAGSFFTSYPVRQIPVNQYRFLILFLSMLTNKSKMLSYLHLLLIKSLFHDKNC